MSNAEQETVVRRYVEEVLNRGDLAAAEELFATDFAGDAHDDEVLGILGEGERGRDGAIDAIAMLRRAVPDLRYRVDDLEIDGELITLTWTAEGTHTAPLMGRAPTFKRATVSGRGWARIRDGRIVEGGSEWDPRQLEAQLDA